MKVGSVCEAGLDGEGGLAGEFREVRSLANIARSQRINSKFQDTPEHLLNCGVAFS